MRILIVALAALLGFAGSALAACPAAPLGEPVVNGVKTIAVCHPGYLSLLDPAAKETRVVTYALTAEHSHAHGSRAGMTFKVDPLAPAEDQGRASDYAASGYDLGHMMPAEDGAWSREIELSTFSMANVEPQLPGLNRQIWERAEEIVRAEACRHGDLAVFTGPIFPGSKRIGRDRLAVPRGFFKVAVDPKTGWAIAFLMPQAAGAKADAPKKLVAVATAMAATGVTLPLPPRVDRARVTTMDPGVLEDYRAGRCEGRS